MTIETNEEQVYSMPKGSIFKKIAYIISFLGAGSIITSAAMGPGSVASLLTAGADFGYMLLWVAVISGILMGTVAYFGGKIVAISGKNVFEYICEKTNVTFGKILLAIVLITWYMVIFAQGATMLDLMNFLTGTTGLIPTALFIFVVILSGYSFSKGKKTVMIAASLMVVITAVLYLINVFIIGPDPVKVVGGLAPRLPDIQDAVVVAAIIGGSAPGTSALWNSFGVKDKRWITPKGLKFVAWDQAFFGLLFTIFSIAIYISAAAVLSIEGIKVTSAFEAARSLEPIGGSLARWIFSAGFFGALFTTIGGMSTLGSYALNSLFNLGDSLDNPIVKKLVWLGIATVLIGGFAAEHAMAVLVNFLGLLNVGGFIIITLIVYFTASKKHAGEYANSWGLNLLGLILILAGAYAVSTYIAMFF